MNSKTKKNLLVAMQTEALAFAQNARFAAAARMNDNGHLARLFQTAADADRCEHFARESRMAGSLATDAENLKSAIAHTTAKIKMYSTFIEDAIADHDLGAAALFGKIREDEANQLQVFKDELDTLKRSNQAESGVTQELALADL